MQLKPYIASMSTFQGPLYVWICISCAHIPWFLLLSFHCNLFCKAWNLRCWLLHLQWYIIQLDFTSSKYGWSFGIHDWVGQFLPHLSCWVGFGHLNIKEYGASVTEKWCGIVNLLSGFICKVGGVKNLCLYSGAALSLSDRVELDTSWNGRASSRQHVQHHRSYNPNRVLGVGDADTSRWRCQRIWCVAIHALITDITLHSGPVDSSLQAWSRLCRGI